VKRALTLLVVLAAALTRAAAAESFGERADVRAFIGELVERHGFRAADLGQVFSRAQRLEPALQLILPAERPSWQDYRAQFVNDQRIERGLAFWAANRESLARAEREYGVPPQVILAIIGVETNYGRNMGRYRVVDALATLAFDYAPRASFFRSELEQYLLLVREWNVDVFIANAAMGQTGPLSLIPVERLRAVFEVNVFGTFAITQRVAQAMRKKRAGRIIITSSIGGVRAGVGSGPYTMTKHAIQAFGTALRAELKMFGVDVCLINPGPYATGFNDRMANDPGPWFDRKKAAPEDVAVMDQLVQRITVGQMDPSEVVQRYVELVEAQSTELVNFVPPDIVERMSKSMPAR